MADQIEFLRVSSGNVFTAPPATPATLTATLTGITPALLHRRIYAAILQPADSTCIYTYTLTFKLRGVSQGTITQRHTGKGSQAQSGAQEYWMLQTWPVMAGAAQDSRHIPGTLAVVINNATLGQGDVRPLLPIEATLQIDEIVLTCSEWIGAYGGNGDSDSIHVILACLSSLHRF